MRICCTGLRVSKISQLMQSVFISSVGHSSSPIAYDIHLCLKTMASIIKQNGTNAF